MLTETVQVETLITPWDSTPTPESLMAQFLASAQHTLRFCIYGCTLPAYFQGLIDAHRRGVDVKGIFDHSQATGKAEAAQLHALFATLPQANFLIGTSPRAHQIVHLKGCWIDGNRVWSGSWNYSTSATKQVNNIDIITSPRRAAFFQRAWDELWQFISTHEQAYQAYQAPA